MPTLLQDYVGTTVLHYAGGRSTTDQSLPAAVSRNALLALDVQMGTNEYPGDGSITRDDSGDSERRSGYLQVSLDVTVTENDLWGINGDIWTTQRMDARDSYTVGYQAWRITNTKGRRTHHTTGREWRGISR